MAERIDDGLARLDELRRRPTAVAAGALIITALVVGGWTLGRAPSARPVEDLIPQVALDPTSTTSAAPEPLLVHVTGAVAAPGVYELATLDRVLDAVELAGGPLDDADLQQLNLAAPLADGMQIRVPREGEVLPVPITPEGQAVGPVDINRADLAALERLPGIGPATATAIVAWRTENGPFLTIDDLLDVPGIGPAKLAALSDLVTVG